MLRTAIIGLGRISWLLEKDRRRYHPCTHAGTLRRFQDRAGGPFVLAGVCDRNADKIGAFSRWWKKRIEFSDIDYGRLLTEARADLVIIASSLESHHEIAVAAMESGAKALLLEKPVAPDLRRTEDICELARKKRVRIWINFERRYHPAYRMVRKYVLDKKLGELRGIRGQVLTGPVPPGDCAGPLLHDAVHWIDLLLWLAGKPREVTARLVPSSAACGVEDTSFINFIYPDFNAILESGGRRRYFEFSIQIDFSDGRIISGNEGHAFFSSAPSRRYGEFRELRPVKISIPKKNPWTKPHREIKNQLGGTESNSDSEHDKSLGRITTNIDEARSGMELIDRCYQFL